MDALFAAGVASDLRPWGYGSYEDEDGRRLAAMVLDMHDDEGHDGVARFCRRAVCREASLWT